MNRALRCCLPCLLACAGCSPAIYTFTAQPNKVCGGDHVVLTWNASTDGKLTVVEPTGLPPDKLPQKVVPPSGLPSGVPAQGSASVQPSTTVRVHLEVSNLWGSAGRDDDIEVLSGRSLELGQSVADPSAACGDGVLSVTATAPAQSWSATAQVNTIASLAGDKHTYHVKHAGVEADLAPGASTQAFQKTSVTGPWLLSLTLLDGEKCGTKAVPHTLGVELTTICTPG